MDIQKLNLTLADIEIQLMHRLALAESDLSEMMGDDEDEEEMDDEMDDECDCEDPDECDCED
jgi:hypothetical protein